MSTGEQSRPHVVLGVTGGIAAYKACELLRLLQKGGAEVQVIMTKNACEFVNPLTFETLSGYPAVTDTFNRPERWSVEHVAMAKWADLFVIAPATANILAKMAAGIADDMLSTTVLATSAPVLVAPAMNSGMYLNAATQANMSLLHSRGIHFVDPASGYLACGDTGVGKLAPVEEIAARCFELLGKAQDLAGLRVLVTAGPTREMLDPVRYITNRSSGKMGYALAAAAKARGAEVTLLTGPVSLSAPAGVRVVPFLTTADLLEAMLKYAGDCDVIIQAAAPADYRPEAVAQQKIKKKSGEPFVLTMVENPDVAATVGAMKKEGQTFVGFAAETENVLEHAAGKLQKKHLDLIVANDVTAPGAGFDVDTNIVTLIARDHQQSLPLATKREVADAILDEVLRLRS